ncbi:MAG TPA: hypothetical protein VJY64_02115 [Candidatus Onthovivens sp.]|nr:hypothetical protein [Candidatus Onthovivens sp.]
MKIKGNLRAILIYLGVVIPLTIIFFFINENIRIMSYVFGICSFFTFFHLLINLYLIPRYSGSKDSTIRFLGFGFLRFLIVGIGLGLSAFLIYWLAKDQNTDNVNYLFLAIGIVPMVISVGAYALKGNSDD